MHLNIAPREQMHIEERKTLFKKGILWPVRVPDARFTESMDQIPLFLRLNGGHY